MNPQPAQHTSDASALATAFLPSEQRPVILTVAQFAIRNPAFTLPALRNLIFKADSRHSSLGVIPGNGLAECGAIIRLGRRVLLDEAKFLAWVATGGRTS